MGHQLRALGHEAVWMQKNDKFLGAGQGINVIVEGFTAMSIDEMRKAHGKGGQFMILATEEPTLNPDGSDKGFNHGTQKEMVMRMQTFPEAAKFAEGIIHLVPGQHVTDWYSRWAPSCGAELGYSPSLMRMNWPQPEWDFGFYGSVTWRRLKVLKALARHCQQTRIKVVSDFKTQDERDREMAKCKVILQVRKFEAMGLVSSSRCNTALSLGRPIIAEPHDLSKPWDEIVRFAKGEGQQGLKNFFDLAWMSRMMWQGIHRDQLAKFKEKLSPEICIGEPLRKIGILGPQRIPDVITAPEAMPVQALPEEATVS